jgi:hypothetical protein
MAETPGHLCDCGGDPTIEARRSARATFAARRIRKIIDGLPALNDEQRRQLAAMLWPYSEPGNGGGK